MCLESWSGKSKVGSCGHSFANRNMLQASKVAPRKSDQTKKWLAWPEYLAMLPRLRHECAGEANEMLI